MSDRRWDTLPWVALALLIAVLLAGAFTAGLALLAGYSSPGATRPCEEAFAATLGRDRIWSAIPPTGTTPAQEHGSGYCTDADDGEVSSAEGEYNTTLTPTQVIDHYREEAATQGWQHIEVFGPEAGAHTLCASRTTPDRHTIQLGVSMLDLQPAYLPRGTRMYTVSLTGDSGDGPC